jgi:cyclic lactone autoinducer peptide
MKHFFNSLLPVCFSVLTAIAVIGGVRPMCMGTLWYQPEVPKSLRA